MGTTMIILSLMYISFFFLKKVHCSRGYRCVNGQCIPNGTIKMIFVISKSNIKNNDKAKKDLFLQIIVLSYREGI